MRYANSLMLALGVLGQPAALPPTLLWSEDHETNRVGVTYGRLNNWYEGQSNPDDDSADAGGSYVRGATGGASTNFAHGGTYAMRSRISVTPTATVGVRTNYRVFAEADPLRDLYYGAWYYLPNVVTVGNFWQHMQWKVRNMEAGTAPYVAYALYIYNPNAGEMAYRLTYKLGEDANIPGPYAGGGVVAYSEESQRLYRKMRGITSKPILNPPSITAGASRYGSMARRSSTGTISSRLTSWQTVVIPGISPTTDGDSKTGRRSATAQPPLTSTTTTKRLRKTGGSMDLPLHRGANP